MTDDATVDDRWYEAVKPNSLSERILIRARDRIYLDFMSEMRPAPGDRLLDIGVSDVINDGANLLERKYPHPEMITAAGIGLAGPFEAAFPSVAFRKIVPGEKLPFGDGSFEIATSNAVLEHVGSTDAQLAFIAEHGRVGRRAFITVPNRYFPVEHHTALPLAHWTDPSFRFACRMTGKEKFADRRELILMSARRLRRLAKLVLGKRAFRIGTTGLGLGPFSSNLYLTILPS